jgi:Spy/CpxP family protein refolding chaperone
VLIGTLAACGHHRYSDTPEKHLNYITDEVSKKLELNETQQAKLATLKSELLSITTQARAEHESIHNTLEELLTQPTLNQPRLVELITQKSTAINERAPAVVAALAGFYDTLTPEQQAKLREEIRDHKEGHHRSWFH